MNQSGGKQNAPDILFARVADRQGGGGQHHPGAEQETRAEVVSGEGEVQAGGRTSAFDGKVKGRSQFNLEKRNECV